MLENNRFVEASQEPKERFISIVLPKTEQQFREVEAISAVSDAEAQKVTTHTCEVCEQNPVYGVYSSSLGAVSFGYCEDCAKQGAEPYGSLIFSLGCAHDLHEWDKKEVHELYRESRLVTSTLKAAGKTFEEFVSSVREDIVREQTEMERWYIETAIISLGTEEPDKLFTDDEIHSSFNQCNEPGYVIPLCTQLGDDHVLFYACLNKYVVFKRAGSKQLKFVDYVEFV